MQATEPQVESGAEASEPGGVEHVDVLIVGAGLSGIGAACQLQERCPGKTFAILESRGAIGGTWDLFRYPGIRSDSDMFTLGYSFRPWTGAKAIADGGSIRDYIVDTAREHGIDDKIRFHQRVVSADWSTPDARWTVQVEHPETHARSTITCGFLHTCAGYYRYDEGYTPDFKGRDRFTGTIIHPQHWPADLDCTGKRVVIIGSGATAVTLVPALAETAAHVTMLQRSPTYIVSRPVGDALADALRRVLPAKLAYAIVRWKNVLLMMFSYQLSRHRPSVMKRIVRVGLERQLPKGYDIDTHFTPTYEPWDQRLCVVPDGDLFKAIRQGRAEVVTDRIATFTETGIELESGAELAADIIVTATGLQVQTMGGATVTVDGEPVRASDTVSYKGMMLSGVPNLTVVMGYTNASWTLKCDLVSEYVCRLLNHMDELGLRQCTPLAPDPSLPRLPFIDLSAGYVQRAIEQMPKQGSKAPWRLHQNYPRDIAMLRRGALEDEGMQFSNPG